MHVVPKRAFKSLYELALKSVNALIEGSNLRSESEDDIKSAKHYLDQLPSSIRLRVAKFWTQELNPHFWLDPELDTARNNYALWRVTCFLPNEKCATLDFPIADCDRRNFGARALKHVAEQCSVQDIKNGAVELHGDLSYKCKDRFKTLLSHCGTNLTEVTLKGNAGDACLKAVGEQCKKLRKLTLGGRSFTDFGFMSFASNQAGNPDFAELQIKDSSIKFRGLVTVWQTPLPVKILVCDAYNFRLDDGTKEEELMQCPNGPCCGLTDLNISWSGVSSWNKESATIRAVLFKSEVLFPNLKRMAWINPTEDLFASGSKWEAVEVFDQEFQSELNIRDLAANFPNVISMALNFVKPLTALGSLEKGSFEFLTSFEFGSISFQGSLPFMTLRSILAETKNIRYVTVAVTPEVVDQYCDEPFCQMLGTFDHLKNLKWLEFLNYKHPIKINLTQTSLTCVLNKCKDIRFLGDLRHWKVDPEAVLDNIKGYDLENS